MRKIARIILGLIFLLVLISAIFYYSRGEIARYMCRRSEIGDRDFLCEKWSYLAEKRGILEWYRVFKLYRFCIKYRMPYDIYMKKLELAKRCILCHPRPRVSTSMDVFTFNSICEHANLTDEEFRICTLRLGFSYQICALSALRNVSGLHRQFCQDRNYWEKRNITALFLNGNRHGENYLSMMFSCLKDYLTPEICEKIDYCSQSRRTCYEIIGIKNYTRNYGCKCEYDVNRRVEKVVKTGNLSYCECEGFTPQNLLDKCYFGVAGRTDNKTLCKLIKDKELMQICFNLPDITSHVICSAVSDKNMRKMRCVKDYKGIIIKIWYQ